MLYPCMFIKSVKTPAHDSAFATSYKPSRWKELLAALISIAIMIAQIALTSRYLVVQWSKEQTEVIIER
jgi:hypothetical protein